jgi:hypothetical protein
LTRGARARDGDSAAPVSRCGTRSSPAACRRNRRP